MTISAFSLETFDIRLSQNVSTAVGSLGDRSGVRLTLTTADGEIGRGESAPIPGSPEPAHLDNLAAAVRAWAESAVGTPVDEALGTLDSTGITPLPRFAVHTALADLASRAAGAPLHQWLRAGSPAVVETSSLITSSTPASVHEEVGREVAAGVRSMKLKVGGPDTGLDATRVIAASEAAGPDIELRLDANRSWSRDDTIRVIGRVGRHRISYIEDPTAIPAEYGAIAKETGVAVGLDVTVGQAPDLDRLLAMTGATVLVVKAAAVGGVDRLVDAARHMDDDHKLIVSSSLDGPIGLLAGLHAAAALPGPSRAHGLATARLVTGMPEWLEPVSGSIELSSQPGVGADR